MLTPEQLSFKAKVQSEATLRYVPHLAFGFEQNEDNGGIEASEWVDVDSGDSTSLIGTKDEKYFGPVTHNPHTKVVACENKTDGPTDLNLGLVKGDGVNERFEAILLWKELQRGKTVSTRFIPILQAYAVTKYNGPGIPQEKPESEPIWSQNLNKLDKVTDWKLVEKNETFDIQPMFG